MDMNEYALRIFARDRLVEMRAAGERSHRVRAARPAPRPLRVALGHALIRMGHRLQGIRACSPKVRHGYVEAGLVEALRRDDPDGAEQLVARYGARVYRLALDITGVKEDAEEAAADALRTVAGTIHTFKGESPFASWVDRTVAHAAYRKLRGRRPPVMEIALADVVPPLDGDGQHFEPMDDWSNRVDEHARQGALRGILTDAIDALPADSRTALVLHDVEGASVLDIAKILGVGVPEVKSHLHRARLFVRKRLSEYFASA